MARGKETTVIDRGHEEDRIAVWFQHVAAIEQS